MSIRPFKLAVSDSAIAGLQERLARTRFPDQVGEVPSLGAGTDLAFKKELIAYWRNEFDWYAQQTRLNDSRTM